MQKSDAKEAEARAASAASAASTAAADGQSIEKDHAAASVGTVASEVQKAKGKDDKILALIQERKSTAKNEKEKSEKSAKRSKSASETTRGRNDKKNSKDPGRSQRYKEHFQYQISEEANPHPQSQKQRRRSRKDETGNRK